MGFAEDEVYNYILRNLQNFRNIRVASLADSLSCLTDADRDELHAREETRGSQATVYKFYQHLRCRQGWVLDLINALNQNNAGHLADELQHIYDSCQPRRPAPAAVSIPPVASNGHSPVSSIGAQMPPPWPNPALGALLAEQPRQDLPASSCPPLLPRDATTTSTSLDARAPVQESLSKDVLEKESSWRPPPGNIVRDGASDGHSGEGNLLHPTKATQFAAGTSVTASAAVPSVAPSEWGRDWLSRQQHPVCVDNGCFGNANHLQGGALGLGLGRSLPPRDTGVARSPEQPRNEPEEDVYVSSESLLRLQETARSGGQQQPPNSLSNKQAVPSSEHGEPQSSSVDVRSPLLIQQQFDAEQKQVRMLREHRGNEETRMETTTSLAAPAPRDASLSCDTSLKPPVQEKNVPKGEAASSTPSMPMKEKVDPLSTVAGSFEGTSGRAAPWGSSVTRICAPNSNMESDVELSKPSVLLSVAMERPEMTVRCQSSQRPGSPDSGASGSFSFSSDPLLVSSDSSCSGGLLSRVSPGRPAPAAHEDPRGEEAAGANRDSCPPPSCNSTSLGMHEVHVDHEPSIQLGAGSNLQDGADPLGNPPVHVSNRGHGSTTSSSEAKVPTGDNNGPSLAYVVPAVGIAVISAVAFLVYARLQK
ncbi:MAVS protein, partial [Thinocorus orbignyianus]|nr:MAVS protein [Thinocorus orbignyianus]